MEITLDLHSAYTTYFCEYEGVKLFMHSDECGLNSNIIIEINSTAQTLNVESCVFSDGVFYIEVKYCNERLEVSKKLYNIILKFKNDVETFYNKNKDYFTVKTDNIKGENNE